MVSLRQEKDAILPFKFGQNFTKKIIKYIFVINQFEDINMNNIRLKFNQT